MSPRSARPTSLTMRASMFVGNSRSIVVLGLLSACSGAAPETNHSYLGTWKVVGHLSAPISALSDAEADTWIGATFELGEGDVRWKGEHLAVPDYRLTQQPSGEFSRSYRMDPSRFGIASDHVSILRVTADGGPFSELILVSPQRAWLPCDGVFFELER